MLNTIAAAAAAPVVEWQYRRCASARRSGSQRQIELTSCYTEQCKQCEKCILHVQRGLLSSV
jgi:hypothetical protein